MARRKRSCIISPAPPATTRTERCRDLQGDKNGIDQVVAAMQAGSKKSSKDNTVVVVPAQPDPNLKTFTVFNWTSTTRNIMTPITSFSLRPDDNQISPNEAKAVWNNIAENTLKGDDLTKVQTASGG